jgi:molybdopterin-guanine dinucleotide biosynthesis protein A
LGGVAVSVNERGRFDFTGAMELTDSFPNMGPLNGIVSGFENSAEEFLLLTGTDLPFGEPELAKRLRSLMGESDACVLRRGVKGMEPLFAVYRRSCLAPARACLEQGKKSFRDLLEQISVRYVSTEELPDFDLDKILMNVNTPEEYSRAGEEK